MSDQTMDGSPFVSVTIWLIGLGTVCAVVALIYFADSANSLPSFLPGHTVGDVHRHTKNGVASSTAALVCWAAAWFSAGRKPAAGRGAS